MSITQTLKNSADGLRSIPEAISIKFKQARGLSLSDYKAGFAKAANKALWTNPLREETTFAKALSFSYLALVFFITLQFQIAYITSILIAFSAFKILDTAGILLYKVTPGIFDKIKMRYDHKRQTQSDLYPFQVIWQLLKEAKSIWNAEVPTGGKKSGKDPSGNPGSNPNGDGNPGSNPNGDDTPGLQRNDESAPSEDELEEKKEPLDPDHGSGLSGPVSPSQEPSRTSSEEKKDLNLHDEVPDQLNGRPKSPPNIRKDTGDSHFGTSSPSRTGNLVLNAFGNFFTGSGTGAAVELSEIRPENHTLSAALDPRADSENQESIGKVTPEPQSLREEESSDSVENASTISLRTAVTTVNASKRAGKSKNKSKKNKGGSSEQPETPSVDAPTVPGTSNGSNNTEGAGASTLVLS
ncbi:MAG: hypothetical protein VX737_04230 [Pseudomonadota bacterium]|nr:hypothetical protein [Pseudomonadota bacterium]